MKCNGIFTNGTTSIILSTASPSPLQMWECRNAACYAFVLALRIKLRGGMFIHFVGMAIVGLGSLDGTLPLTQTLSAEFRHSTS